MLRVSGSLLSVVFICLAVGGLLISPHALADSPTGNSIIITASIAPVRYIVVNDHGAIIEILSNTRSDVTPSVYKNRPDSPVALTEPIRDQYAALIRHIDLHETGVVYKSDASANNESVDRRGWMGLSSYQSILGRTAHTLLLSTPIMGQRT
jgi:hypothetical protein